MKYAKAYKFQFNLALFFAVVISITASIRPFLTKTAIDEHIMLKDYDGLVLIVTLMFLVIAVEVLIQYGYIYMANWLGQKIIKDIRNSLYKHMLSFRMQYYDKNPIGTLVTRVVSDIETISEIFGQGLLMIISDVMKMLVVLIIMFYVNWQLALIVITVLPILAYGTRIFQKNIKSAFQDVRNQVSRLNSFVQEHITGMKIVQLFAREDQEFEKFKEINRQHRKAHVRSVWYYSIFFPFAELLSSIALGLVVWYGGIKTVTTQDVTLGELIAYINLIQLLFRPLRQLADKFNILQMGMVSAERVFAIFDTALHISKDGDYCSKEMKGHIVFDKVSFEYDKDHPILKDISFSVKPGQMIAIVGATGAGKSTIINILNRFYEYSSGSVSIDGVKIEDYSLKCLRQHVAVVLQDVFLFSDSIINNITLMNNISRERIIKAAKEIEIHDFIDSLPNKYDYNVRERGAMLSVGQRQLLSFLRAYVSDPSILVLDEATSSVDTYSEILIQKATEKITQNRTSIVIAHRLSTIRKAEKIIVIDKGRIVEIGTHKELFEKNGFYKKLYEHQFHKDLEN
ncbi:MAG: ABC transporter ATP-binding protein [Flavobacteriales bacterium]|nr:ABC transporter ATP-binding protein [Flavobacteriales bacterium]